MVSLNQIPGIVLIFGIIVIFGVVMATLVTDLQQSEIDSNPGYNNSAINISSDSQAGLLNMAGKLPLLGTIVILAAVIGVVIGVFRFRGGGF